MERPDFKPGVGRIPSLCGFDSHSFPPLDGEKQTMNPTSEPQARPSGSDGATGAGRRALPSVDALLRHDHCRRLIDEFGRQSVTDGLRSILVRERAAVPRHGGAVPDQSAIVLECAQQLRAAAQPSLRPVFNLTGTVLHTNLGRALLPDVAIAAMTRAMSEPVNLEFDVDGGDRGERDDHVESWLVRLTGAAAATVVNNNAAAVYLALNSLALRKEVVVSRGELVEIGGSFRIPDIMARAGCRLRETGTTNRTHLRDFADAISNRTAAIMKVHASNFSIRGFTASVPARDLAILARERGVLLVNDLGCGSLVDLEDWGLPHEPTAREAIADGADIVTFSGDKLLGGPQCGLIVGRTDLISRIRRNPMKRALRLDKARLAALEAVLRLYADPGTLARRLPTLGLLTRKQADIRAQAERILPALRAALTLHADVEVVDCMSQVGSGALPEETLPSAGIAIRMLHKSGSKGRSSPRAGLHAMAAAFRRLQRPVIGRINDAALVFDLRCLPAGADDEAGFVSQLDSLSLPPSS